MNSGLSSYIPVNREHLISALEAFKQLARRD